MNKFIKASFSVILFTIAVMTIGNSCKKQFDAPPADVPAANLTPNYTIAQLKAKHTDLGKIEIIDSSADIIIRGIVIADDKSGNFYKTLVIQDSTGGLAVLINGNSLYNNFPIGRELFIKANRLYLGDYSGQIQLGGGIQTGTTPTLADIPVAVVEKNIFKGTLNNVVVPKDVTPGQLGTTLQDKYVNTLIRLSNFEFGGNDTSKTFASAGVTSPTAASFDLFNCSNITSPSSDPFIELRTSNYANFASAPLPNGNGTITAIYSVFTTKTSTGGTRSSKQLAIRDTADVKFYGSRCGTAVIPPPVTGNVLLNETFETATNNADVNISGWKNIAETGTWKYQVKTYSNNKYAQMNPFSSSNQQPVVKTWLITPGINLNASTNEILTFKTLDGYVTGSTLKAYYSTNYTGSNTPWTATWTQLSATIATGGPAVGYAADFTNSGNLSLNAITGTVYIAFVYEGGYLNPTVKTTAYEIDDVKIIAD